MSASVTQKERKSRRRKVNGSHGLWIIKESRCLASYILAQGRSRNSTPGNSGLVSRRSRKINERRERRKETLTVTRIDDSAS